MWDPSLATTLTMPSVSSTTESLAGAVLAAVLAPLFAIGLRDAFSVLEGGQICVLPMSRGTTDLLELLMLCVSVSIRR